MFDKLEEVARHFEELNRRLSDPTIYDNQEEFKVVSEEHARLRPIIQVYENYKKNKENLQQVQGDLKRGIR